MKVTVCALSDNEIEFTRKWPALIAHCREHQPQLVLLPELPFSQWLAHSPSVSIAEKKESLRKHEYWESRLKELDVKYVVYSKPVIADEKAFNTAFLYEKEKGFIPLHAKSRFPEEPHFYEESCYSSEGEEFKVFDTGGVKIGVLLCSEMWFTDKARLYGKQGVDLLLCPRATGISSVAQWMRLGQTLAVISGAYCLSANKAGYDDENKFQWGGNAWIAAPGNGDLLGVTDTSGFVTVEIDLNKAKIAKEDFPLYIK